MKIDFDKEIKPSLLMDELLESVPELVKEEDGERVACFTLTRERIRFPDELEGRVIAVINAHNPAKQSAREMAKDKNKAVISALMVKLQKDFTDEEIAILFPHIIEKPKRKDVTRD